MLQLDETAARPRLIWGLGVEDFASGGEAAADAAREAAAYNVDFLERLSRETGFPCPDWRYDGRTGAIRKRYVEWFRTEISAALDVARRKGVGKVERVPFSRIVMRLTSDPRGGNGIVSEVAGIPCEVEVFAVGAEAAHLKSAYKVLCAAVEARTDMGRRTRVCLADGFSGADMLAALERQGAADVYERLKSACRAARELKQVGVPTAHVIDDMPFTIGELRSMALMGTGALAGWLCYRIAEDRARCASTDPGRPTFAEAMKDPGIVYTLSDAVCEFGVPVPVEALHRANMVPAAVTERRNSEVE